MQGKACIIEVYEDKVCITSKGPLARAIRGKTGKKEIPLASVGCIRFKRPGLTSGYIQLVVQGDNVTKKSFVEIEKDDNAFTFNSNAEQAQRIKDFIESKIVKTTEEEMLLADEALQREQNHKPVQEEGGTSQVRAINSSSIQPKTISNRPVFTMQGVSGLLEVYADKLCITPKGALGFLTQGLKGTKTIPFYSITAIQFKESGIGSGYIQFTIPGGNESKSGLFAAAADENSFMFAGDNDTAREIKEYIEMRIYELRSPPSASNAQPPERTYGLADELEKLSSLKEKGLLTEDEFIAAKKRLIG